MLEQMELEQMELEQLAMDMKRIEEKVDRMNALLEAHLKVSQRMDRHIDFIERTYEQLHTPLSYIKNRIYSLVGKGSSKELEHVEGLRPLATSSRENPTMIDQLE